MRAPTGGGYPAWIAAGALLVLALALPSGAAAVKPGIDRNFSVVERFASSSFKHGTTTLRNDLVRRGRKVGSDRFRCRTPRKVTRCRVVYRLSEGSIRARGDVGKGSGPFRITGGTRAYRGASGTVQGRKLRRHTVLVTFHITK